MSIEIFGRIFKFLTDPEQWEKMINFITNYFIAKPITIVAVIAFLLVCYIVIRFRMGKVHNIIQEKRYALILYIIFIIVLSVLNRDTGDIRILRLSFDSWFAGDTAFHESNVLISIVDCLYFIPYGFLIKWQFPKNKNIFFSILLVILSAFVIEFFQYILIKGVASISDFIFYSLGGIIGIFFINLCQKNHDKGVKM